MVEIVYQTDLHAVDWAAMKTILRQDAFDNGRSPQQLKASFENSYAACVAYANRQSGVIGWSLQRLSGGRMDIECLSSSGYC